MRPTCWDILNEPERWPEHYRALTVRALHVRTRCMERFGLKIGLGTYLSMTDAVGRAVAKLLRTENSARFTLGPSNKLFYPRNPKYFCKVRIWGSTVGVIYDAYDKMILTVVPLEDDFHIHENIYLMDVELEISKQQESEA